MSELKDEQNLKDLYRLLERGVITADLTVPKMIKKLEALLEPYDADVIDGVRRSYVG